MESQYREIALEACIEKNLSLTPNRLLIFEIISKCVKPVTAYELQALLGQKGSKYNIATVYRVIEFWREVGLVHRIAYLNKFLACCNPQESHTHMINFCTGCEAVFETCNERMELDLQKGANFMGLTIPQSAHIEIPVTCSSCE